jgi:hypothetical protein
MLWFMGIFLLIAFDSKMQVAFPAEGEVLEGAMTI